MEETREFVETMISATMKIVSAVSGRLLPRREVISRLLKTYGASADKVLLGEPLPPS